MSFSVNASHMEEGSCWFFLVFLFFLQDGINVLRLCCLPFVTAAANVLGHKLGRVDEDSV